MYELNCDLIVIGAGPAGLASARAAKREGAQRVLVIERDSSIGGILQQCIHPGFGLTYFGEELTGPEYAGNFEDLARDEGVDFLMDTMVLEILEEEGSIICINSKYGMTKIKAKSIILAMGCRERTRFQIQIPGFRPAGIYTAGTAQRLINRQNKMVGKKVIILGSGDIGMIMARRLTLEGAEVVGVVEIMDYLSGLSRNRVQCLDDFNIPLFLGHTITKIVGNNRVEGVYISKVDKDKCPILENERFFECDTVLFSVGLIPENELSRNSEVEISDITNGPIVNQYMQTSIDCIFACGNVVHVNDLVDNVSMESEIAGKYAARYALGVDLNRDDEVQLTPGENIRYLCPQKINLNCHEKVKVYFRVLNPEENVILKVTSGNEDIYQRKINKVNPGEMESFLIDTGKLNKNEIQVKLVREV